MLNPSLHIFLASNPRSSRDNANIWQKLLVSGRFITTQHLFFFSLPVAEKKNKESHFVCIILKKKRQSKAAAASWFKSCHFTCRETAEKLKTHKHLALAHASQPSHVSLGIVPKNKLLIIHEWFPCVTAT